MPKVKLVTILSRQNPPPPPSAQILSARGGASPPFPPRILVTKSSIFSLHRLTVRDCEILSIYKWRSQDPGEGVERITYKSQNACNCKKQRTQKTAQPGSGLIVPHPERSRGRVNPGCINQCLSDIIKDPDPCHLSIMASPIYQLLSSHFSPFYCKTVAVVPSAILPT